MGDRFYAMQATYFKDLNKRLRAAGTKETIINKILDIDPYQDISKLKKLLKEPLFDLLNTLQDEINMTQWNQELKDAVIQEYKAANPTPETSMEIIKQLAEDHGVTANGIRMVPVQAEVYVKKDASKSAAKAAGKGDGEGTKRVSKESQLKALKDFLTDAGAPVDEELIDKLTGKAAAYFLEVVKAVSKN